MLKFEDAGTEAVQFRQFHRQFYLLFLVFLPGSCSLLAWRKLLSEVGEVMEGEGFDERREACQYLVVSYLLWVWRLQGYLAHEKQ